MKKFLAIATLFLLVGCAASNIKITYSDGTTKEASASALFTNLNAVKGDFMKETFSVKGAEGALDLQTLLQILSAAAAAQ